MWPETVEKAYVVFATRNFLENSLVQEAFLRENQALEPGVGMRSPARQTALRCRWRQFLGDSYVPLTRFLGIFRLP